MDRNLEKRRTGLLAMVGLGVLAFSAGTASAGVNRWTSNWMDVSGVSCVVIDPKDPAVIYAGTLGRGFFKSGNGGLTWSNPSAELNGLDINSLAIDPLTPSGVYAGASSGVFKSADGVASWRGRLLAASLYTLVVFPILSADNVFQNWFTLAPDTVGGIWTGKFDSADIIGCESNMPAQATFTQNGENVIGILGTTENNCGFSAVSFQDKLQGNSLTGTITGDRFSNGSTATGTLSGTTLDITLVNSFGYIPGGSMRLHR